MAFVVKMSCNGDVRRVRFPGKSDVTLASLRAQVRDMYGIEAFIATCPTSDGGKCVLTGTTLQQALRDCGDVVRIDVMSFGEMPGMSPQLPELVNRSSPRVPWPPAELVNRSSSSVAATSAGSSSACPPAVEEGVVEFPIHTPGVGSPRDSGAAGRRGDEDFDVAAAYQQSTSDSDAGDAADVASAASTTDSTASTLDTEIADPAAQPEELADEARQPSMAAALGLPHPSGSQGDAVAAALPALDKISILLAAFDANGDGYLSTQEFAELRRWSDGALDAEAFATACAELGADPARGLGAGGLAAVYAAYGDLDHDFDAALARLQDAAIPLPSAPPAEERLHAAGGTWRGLPRQASPGLRRFMPLVGLVPLALCVPVFGIPIALLAAHAALRKRDASAGRAGRATPRDAGFRRGPMWQSGPGFLLSSRSSIPPCGHWHGLRGSARICSSGGYGRTATF